MGFKVGYKRSGRGSAQCTGEGRGGGGGGRDGQQVARPARPADRLGPPAVLGPAPGSRLRGEEGQEVEERILPLGPNPRARARVQVCSMIQFSTGHWWTATYDSLHSTIDIEDVNIILLVDLCLQVSQQDFPIYAGVGEVVVHPGLLGRLDHQVHLQHHCGGRVVCTTLTCRLPGPTSLQKSTPAQ